ncbi:MAG TPA: DUF1294 domain-containing protein [Opitutaceae bacterium]|nr:DUF1294 domain-containing protein [Opitutaceae bacterium]
MGRARSSPSQNRLRPSHALILALLVLPALAVRRWLGAAALPWAAGWVAAASLVTAGLYWADQRRALAGAWRTPETTLHLASLLGGWPGAFLAQKAFRHKSGKGNFQVVYWLTVALHQFVAIDALRGWAVVEHLLPG